MIFPEGLNLGRRAKFTDLTSISIISYPFLIFSEAFDRVLTNFKLPEGGREQIKLKKGNSDNLILYSIFNLQILDVSIIVHVT